MFRNYIHSHFGCDEGKYLCNDWSCRDEKCDCVPNDDCHSEADQSKIVALLVFIKMLT